MMIEGGDPGRWISAFDLHWVFRLIVGDPAFGDSGVNRRILNHDMPTGYNRKPRDYPAIDDPNRTHFILIVENLG